MIMKVNGKEACVSLYKFYLPDSLIDEVDFLKVQLGAKTNSEVFTHVVAFVAKLLHQQKDYYDNVQVNSVDTGNVLETPISFTPIIPGITNES